VPGIPLGFGGAIWKDPPENTTVRTWPLGPILPMGLPFSRTSSAPALPVRSRAFSPTRNCFGAEGSSVPIKMVLPSDDSCTHAGSRAATSSDVSPADAVSGGVAVTGGVLAVSAGAGAGVGC
jgi:hypothetical protein